MPDEALITRIENLLAEIIELGGANEQTSIVPNLIVQDANPTGLTNSIIVSDDRDGDNIIAQKVGSVVYSDNDLVNVMFVKGTEAIAFQQGSQSTNSGIWEIVPSTSTDIYYDKGNVGIGNSSPTTPLDVTGTVTITDDILHAGDTDTKLSFTDDDIEFTAGNLSMLKLTEAVQDLITLGPGSGDVDINFNGDMFLQGSDGELGIGTTNPVNDLHIVNSVNSQRGIRIDNANAGTGASSSIEFRNGGLAVSERTFFLQTGAGYTAVTGWQDAGVFSTQNGISGGMVLNARAGGIKLEVAGNGSTFQQAVLTNGGDFGIGVTSPQAKLHVDQTSTTAAIPTLSLDQADLSEEFVNFISTIGAGNPIDTAAIGTYYGKVRVAVNGTFKYIALYNS